MIGTRARSFARRVGSPIRNYFNDHFEMVKDEVRQSSSTVSVDETAAWRHLNELERSLAELSLHEARVLSRVGGELADLSKRIEELERVVSQLASVAATATVQAAETVRS